MIKVLQITLESPDWQAFVTHLKAENDARWVLDDQEQPKGPSLIFLAGIVDGEVVGSLTLARQAIISPLTNWAADRDRTLRDELRDPLYETFVQTFRVVESHRRQGIGRDMQEKALAVTRHLDCIQMRSWSSLDAKANYRLKLSLGFGFHPEIQETPGGLMVSGGYFVKRVD